MSVTLSNARLLILAAAIALVATRALPGCQSQWTNDASIYPPYNSRSLPAFDKLITADVNADLHMDVVGVTKKGLLIARGSGTGAFPTTFTILPADDGSTFDDLAVADVNGDGRPDLVIADYNLGRIILYTEKPDWTYNTPVAIAAPIQPRALAVADFDGDNKVDIAITSWETSTLVILSGNGLGGFSESSRATLSSNEAVRLLARDVDHDGLMDLVITHYVSTSVELLYGKAGGSFEVPLLVPMGAYPDNGFAVADLNKDGIDDLVSANWDDSSVAVSLNAGAGRSFGAPVRYVMLGTPPVLSDVAVADVDGDGHPDLLLVDSMQYYMLLMRGHGDGSFDNPTTTTVYDANMGLSKIATADFNEDGKPDVAEAAALAINTFRNRCGEVTMTVTSTNALISTGDDWSVTVTVTPINSSNAPRPTGTVTLKSDGTTLTSTDLDPSGAAAATYSFATAGDHPITVMYGGDSNYGSSSTSYVQKVTAARTTTTVSPLPTLIYPNSSVDITVTITGGSSDTPTGYVTIYPDATVSQTNYNVFWLSGGITQTYFYSATPGDHILKVAYTGDATHPASSVSVPYTVQKYRTTLSWYNTPPAVIQAERTVALSTQLSYYYNATGTIALLLDGRSVAQQVLNGAYSVGFNVLIGAGTHTLQAHYSGDAKYGPSDTPVAMVRSIGGGLPMALDARANQSNVTVTWTAVTGTSVYKIYRAIPPGGFTLLVAQASSAPITDLAALPGSINIYKAEAVDYNGQVLATSNPDLAFFSSFTDDPLLPGITVVKAGHWTEMLTAVNTFRAAARLGAIALPQAINVGDVIKPDAIGVLRNGIADVYNAFSTYALTLNWTDPTITPGVTPVRAAHLQEIRDAMH